MESQITISSKSMPLNWTNSRNAAFYRKMPLSYFKGKAIEGGLDDNCDIKTIISYIARAKSILELGAGYGRVLDYIIKSGFKGELFAVEREPKLCKILKKRFKKTCIFCDDIRTVKFNKKFDLIIWLWTGLWEFSKVEQLPILTHIVSHLNNDGFLVLDLIPITCKTIRAVNIDKNNRIITTPYGNDYTYTPSHAEIKNYARRLKLKNHTITYKTKTGKKRILYIFCKVTNSYATSKKRAISRK